MSITCSVDSEGGARWWLTRESGRLPAQCGLEACSSCSNWTRTHVDSGSYIVIAGGGNCVAFAQLSAGSFEVAVRRVVPLVQEAWLCGCDQQVVAREVFSCFSFGLFSSGVDCACRIGRVCAQCRVLFECGRFVVQGVFMGLPSIPGGWWTGVTDAVGDVEIRGQRYPWLRCAGLLRRRTPWSSKSWQ